jgi:hypothetical protein
MDFKKVRQSNNATRAHVKLRQLFDIFEYRMAFHTYWGWPVRAETCCSNNFVSVLYQIRYIYWWINMYWIFMVLQLWILQWFLKPISKSVETSFAEFAQKYRRENNKTWDKSDLFSAESRTPEHFENGEREREVAKLYSVTFDLRGFTPVWSK